MQIDEIAADEALHHPHELVDLGLRPRPILRRKAVDRQIRDRKLHGGAHRPPDRLHAHAMTDRARQSTRIRPSAIAVHDDGDVTQRLSPIFDR